MLISTSFLSSMNPARDLKLLNETDTDYIHVDVMDGIFVEKDTYQNMLEYSSYIRRISNLPMDIHLMVEDASKLITKYANLNAEYITIHVESENVEQNLKLIKKYAIKAGIAINPETKVKELVPYLPLVDLILVMSVEPGKGGQAFLPKTKNKIKEISKLIQEHKSKAIISVDGGINDETKKNCIEASQLVSGSYILSGDDYQERINSLR